MDFDQFRAIELDTEDAIPEANFLALDGDRLVGVSRVGHDANEPGVLQQEFTGTDPDYHGRGIALALKLLTVEYARDHGIREIRTQNDTANGPMLHINDRLGFKREPGVIVFERVQWRSDVS
jgi:RimJ/RimL family protein N-acetyltransferase